MIVTKQFSYFESKESKVQRAIEKYRKLSVKLGFDEPTVEMRTITFLPVGRASKTGCLVFENHAQCELTVGTWTGHVPAIGGWHLVAKINWEEAGVIVSTVPGQESLGTKYKHHDGHCDHCHTKRRRQQVFVLRDESGDEVTVGKNCLADFLRSDVGLMSFLQASIDDGGELYDGVYQRPVCNPMQVLTLGSFLVRRHGWKSKSAAEVDGTISTFGVYMQTLYNAKEYFKYNDPIEIEDRDMELAQKVIDWAATKADDENDYLRNLSVLARSECVGERRVSLLLSAIGAYQREVDGIERAKVAKLGRSHLNVEVGKRFRKLAVTVKRLRYFDSYYGTTCIVAMEAEQDGTVVPLVWFTTSSQDLREGEQVEIDGTVKEHKSDDKYGPQTVVSRVKIYSATA